MTVKAEYETFNPYLLVKGGRRITNSEVQGYPGLHREIPGQRGTIVMISEEREKGRGLERVKCQNQMLENR